jgi:hypothetical protein
MPIKSVREFMPSSETPRGKLFVFVASEAKLWEIREKLAFDIV